MKTKRVIIILLIILILSGCNKKVEEIEPDYSIYRFSLKSPINSSIVKVELNSVVNGKIIEKGKEIDNNYKVNNGSYALIGNEDYILEFEEKTYTYYLKESYINKYGRTEPSYQKYIEYLNSSLRSDEEKIIKEYKNENIEGIAYINKDTGIIDINYDKFNNYSAFRIYVIKTKPGTNIKDILESDKLTNTIYSIKLTK